ncbi:MAG: UvrD-helicase domain-containing protein, partial [Clostridia bacterium]|nr:UvrD-helicase domain-containing protein [Clostridia bacterium]
MSNKENTDTTKVKGSISWTDAQTDAITASGRNVLVCAAAGSGKTATLTERIIRRLTDESSPADISRMVVVTFTKNAATELKEKIYKAISEKLAQDPDNEHLSLQLMKLPAARISTIHSFCFDIIKKNLSVLGLPSSIRI